METNKEDKQICRAKIAPSTDPEYDFECVAVPAENGQLKYSYREEEYFMQILKVGENNVDRSRLESGLPLFDNHPEMEDAGAMNQLGITTDYGFDERGLFVRCKFGARADEALRTDIKNGIVKTVSIEGEIQSYSIERKAGEIPKYYAELWLPLSLSFAPVPNDIAAQIEVKRAIQKQIEIPIQEKTKYEQLTNKF